jgi:hypothetical protein
MMTECKIICKLSLKEMKLIEQVRVFVYILYSMQTKKSSDSALVCTSKLEGAEFGILIWDLYL